jgi:surface polysaccharide O-acyltransferase-like enzyme
MFMVLALHMVLCKENYPRSIYKSWNCGIANVAIPLFFMVSGALMTNKSNDFTYSLKKIKQILWLVFKTITFLIVIELLFFSREHITHLLRSYYSWIFQKGIMWQYWYFAAMIILYSILPFLGKIIRSKYHLQVIICLVIFCFVVFLLNVFYDFEHLHIYQTFRIWYWCMYFLVGAYIQKHQKLFNWIGWKHVAFIFVFILVYVYYAQVPYDEYAFGSIIYLIYPIIVFSACLNTKINNNMIIQELSSLFIPLYAIHPYVLSKMRLLEPYLNYSPLTQYVLGILFVFCMNVPLAYVLTKIPYIKNIFKM